MSSSTTTTTVPLNTPTETKRMDELIMRNLLIVKKIQPIQRQIYALSNNYYKQSQAYLLSLSQLASSLEKITNSSIPELDDPINSIATMLKNQSKMHDICSKHFRDNIMTIERSMRNVTPAILAMEKRLMTQKRIERKNVLNAHKQAKKAKNPSQLKNAIGLCSNAEEQYQKVLVDALKESSKIVWGIYTTIARLWSNILSSTKTGYEEFLDKMSQDQESIQYLANTKNSFDEETNQLIAPSHLITVDVNGMSKAFKGVLKGAGLKKSDLKNQNTLFLLKHTLDVLVECGLVSIDVRDELKCNRVVPDKQLPSVPFVKINEVIISNPQQSNDIVSPIGNSEIPTTSEQQNEVDVDQINPEVNDTLNEDNTEKINPNDNTNQIPAENNITNTDETNENPLLQSLNDGKSKLKKVPQQTEKPKQMTFNEKKDLTSLLKGVLDERRKEIEDDPSNEEEEEEEEWSV
ncbi:Arp2/3 complex-activating protein rickA [Entamoeba marina]